MTKKRDGVKRGCPFCGCAEIKISVVQGGPRGLRQGIARCRGCGANVNAFSDSWPELRERFPDAIYKDIYDAANIQARERVIEKWDAWKEL